MAFRTREEYRQAWDSAREIDPSICLNLDIELSATCNAGCPFCFLANPEYPKPSPVFMPADRAMLLISRAATLGIPALKFNWRGEATLHPDFSRILGYARGLENFDGKHIKSWAFFDLLLNSNFDFKSRATDGVMACTKVMVSLDSCKRETYEKMRVGLDFDNVVNNIKSIIGRNHPDIWLRRTITEQNKNEDFGTDCLEMFGSFGKFKVGEHAEFNRKDSGEFKKPVGRTYCGYPSRRLVVATNGDVFPCCMAYCGTLVIGNAFQKLLDDIWNGAGIARLRRILREAKTSGELINAPWQCQDCRSWMAYDHPNRNLVEDKNGTT